MADERCPTDSVAEPAQASVGDHDHVAGTRRRSARPEASERVVGAPERSARKINLAGAKAGRLDERADRRRQRPAPAHYASQSGPSAPRRRAPRDPPAGRRRRRSISELIGRSPRRGHPGDRSSRQSPTATTNAVGAQHAAIHARAVEGSATFPAASTAISPPDPSWSASASSPRPRPLRGSGR